MWLCILAWNYIALFEISSSGGVALVGCIQEISSNMHLLMSFTTANFNHHAWYSGAVDAVDAVYDPKFK